jgi:hypothetical protein
LNPITVRRRRTAGQALVETALVLPLFLTLLLGIVDMGRAVWATTSLASAAREATRFAIVHGGAWSTACPVGPHSPDNIIPAPSASCPYPSDSKKSIEDAAIAAAIAGGSNVSVTVCYSLPGTGCTGNNDTADNSRGNTVTVVVTSDVNLIVPSLLGRSSFTLSGSSTMVVNH